MKVVVIHNSWSLTQLLPNSLTWAITRVLETLNCIMSILCDQLPSEAHSGHSTDLCWQSFSSAVSGLAAASQHHPRRTHFKASNRNSSVGVWVLLW